MTQITASTSVGDPWVETRRNYIPNPVTSGTGFWSAGAASTSGHSVTMSNAGAAIRATLTSSGGPTSGSWWVSTTLLPLPVGAKAVSLAARCRASVGNTYALELVFYDSTGATISSATSPTYVGAGESATGSSGDKKLENVAVPTDAVNYRARIRSVGGVDGDFIDGWRWMLEVGPTVGGYFSGAIANEATLQYVWTGGTNASASIAQTRLTNPTLVLGYQAERESESIVHKLIGGEMAVVLYPAALRSGTLSLFYPDEASAFVALQLLSRGCIYTLADSGRTSADMSFIVRDRVSVELDDETRDAFVVKATYQEVTL